MQWYLGCFETNSLTNSPMFSLLDMFLYIAVQMCWIVIAFWSIRRMCSRCMEQKIKRQWYVQPLFKSNRILGGIALLLLAGIGCSYLMKCIYIFFNTKVDCAFIQSTMPKYCLDYVLFFVAIGVILVSMCVIAKNTRQLFELHKEFTIRCEKEMKKESE